VRFPDAPCPPELAGGPTATAAHPASPAGTPGGYSPPYCDISGQWLPGISRVALSYGLEYTTPVQVAGRAGGIYFGFDGSYRSKFSSNASRSAYTDISGYGLANFRAGVRSTNGWDVYAWVHNALNREYFDFLSVQSGSTGLIVGEPGDPRTYGATIRVSF
jgi:iron complex outermembrane receptor protein